MIDFTVVIPAYNEEKRITKTLKDIGKYFSKSDIKCEVIVVVNNTTDNTVGVVNKISKKYPFITAVDVKGYTGKGGAISIGVKLAKGKYIAYQDADGSSNVDDLLKGFYKMKADTSLDIVMGSRYIKDSHISGNLPVSRFVISRMFNFVVRSLFKLNFADTQCAVKIMKKSVAKKLLRELTAKTWTVDVNILIDSKFEGYNLVEYPINWIYKDGSKLNYRLAFFEVSKELLALKVYFFKRQIQVLAKNIESSVVNLFPLRQDF